MILRYVFMCFMRLIYNKKANSYDINHNYSPLLYRGFPIYFLFFFLAASSSANLLGMMSGLMVL